MSSARAADASGEDGEFEVGIGDGSVVRTRKLLFPTGVADELPEKPGFKELWDRGVYPCPYYHAWEIRDRPRGVLNSSEGAAEHAALIRN